MEINKSQYIYDVVYKELCKLMNEENVYYTVPMNSNTQYPFAVLENTQSISINNKTVILEKIYIDVSLWSNINNKHVLGDISLRLKNNLLKYNLKTDETSEEIIKDTSTDEVLFRQVLSLVFL